MEFKSRVREDMLVRLLDAFVWRNHGQWTLYTCDIILMDYSRN